MGSDCGILIPERCRIRVLEIGIDMRQGERNYSELLIAVVKEVNRKKKNMEGIR